MKHIFSFVLLILILFAFSACSKSPKEATPITEESSPKTEEAPQEEEKADPPEQVRKNHSMIPRDNDYFSTLKNLESYQTHCKGEVIELNGPILEIAKRLEAQQFEYNPKNLADCSGMFHRFMQELAKACPNFTFPKPKKARDSRALAKWFHKNGPFTLIFDAKKQKDLIKPGAVMFYGYGGKVYENFTAKDLFVRGKGINHVGIVVEVEKDEDGNVINYHLFHGRNPRHPAGITSFHNLVPTRDTYPPLGNGPEQWVAFAPVISDLVKNR